MSVAMAGSREVRIEALYTDESLRLRARVAALGSALNVSGSWPLSYLGSTERYIELDKLLASGGLNVSVVCVTTDRDAALAHDLIAKAPPSQYVYVDFAAGRRTAGIPCLEDSLIPEAASEVLHFARGLAAGRNAAELSATSLLVREGDTTSPVTWRVTPALAHVLEIAIGFHERNKEDPDFRITFKSLFRACLISGGLLSESTLQVFGRNPQTVAQLGDLGSIPKVAWNPTSPERVSSSTAKVIHFARGHALATKSLVDIHHVFGAILFDEHGHRDDLDDWHVDRVAWGNEFVERIAELAPHEADHWREVRDAAFPVSGPAPRSKAEPDQVQSPPQRVQPVTPTPAQNIAPVARPALLTSLWDRPNLDNDRVGEVIKPEHDKLDASPHALRIAKLFVADDVKPPLAVGLFGNWGSGKSFFMGLMKSHVETLTNDTAGGVYVKRAVQIDFNAWHYQDTNLWASLAMRIFDRIAEELSRDTKDVDDKSPEAAARRAQAERAKLHSKLESSESVKREAEIRQEKALASRTAAEQELAKIKADRASAGADLLRLWSETHRDEYKPAREALVKLADHFGISAFVDAGKQQLRDVNDLRAEIERTRASGMGLVQAVSQFFQGGPGVGAARLGLAAVLLVCLFTPWLIELAEHGLRALVPIPKQLPQLQAGFVQATALITAVVTWCGKRLKELREASDHVIKLNERLKEARTQVKSGDKLDEAQRKVAQLDQEIHKAREQVAAAETEITALTAQIDRIDRGGLVYDFLQERRASASYLGQLGLISTIRGDLDKLQKLLTSHKTHPIERVILYVDDLDRCHPDKVVEVLQAVHLLLALDMFHVVVGVDPRWLERSLRRQYVGKAGTGRKQDQDSFDPNDYLEKIFQIPFALRKLDQGGFEKLADSYMQTRSEAEAAQKKKEDEERAKAEARLAEQQKSTATEDLDKAIGTLDIDGLKVRQPKTATTPTPTSTGSSGSDGRSTTRPSTPAATRPSRNPSAPLDRKTERAALIVENYEQQFLKRLGGFVERPRLAKRLVNLYRLARLSAAETAADLHEFAGAQESEGYRATLVLLAIVVRYPECAARIMEALPQRSDDEPWGDFIADLAKLQPTGDWTTTQCEAMRATEQRLQQIADAPAQVGAFKKRVRAVECFSFRGSRLERPAAVPHARAAE